VKDYVDLETAAPVHCAQCLRAAEPALGEDDLAIADLERALELAEDSRDERPLHQIQEALVDLQER
jgi:hypothetical protein